MQAKLNKLNDQSRKDDLVTFEELGIDRLFVDEAHYYKNLAAFSKMRNVGGISQTEAMKSSDLYMKSRYLDEITGGRGTVFATGTPISNSMVEMYTMQKYLQYGTLKEKTCCTLMPGQAPLAKLLLPLNWHRRGLGIERKHALPGFITCRS